MLPAAQRLLLPPGNELPAKFTIFNGTGQVGHPGTDQVGIEVQFRFVKQEQTLPQSKPVDLPNQNAISRSPPLSWSNDSSSPVVSNSVRFFASTPVNKTWGNTF